MTDGSSFQYLTVPLLSIFIGATVPVQLLQECSSFCACDTWYGLQRASCIGRHLYSIDAGAPTTVQALDLSDNVISFLNSYELATAGLTKLKYLNLSNNAISEIGLNAFDGLKDLSVLDLSRNRLYHILHQVFEEHANLRILRLSRNNFKSHIPNLRSSSITELWLDSCQISHLPQGTFNGLTRIRRLDLSNNLMIQMSSTVVQPLHFLNKLSLKGNPWSCDRIMLDLEIYLKRRRVRYDEICGKKQGPQKFEKMILFPTTKPYNYHRPIITGMPTEGTKSVTKNTMPNTGSNGNLAISKQRGNEQAMINSSYWLLCLGFIAGLSTGLVISYIWLSGKVSCYRSCNRRERLHDVSQRLSLLNSYLHYSIDSDGSLLESCPGTPPPPYREAMLRPSAYHCPSIASILNNNGTGYSQGYT